jgi:gluconate kinase
MPLVKVTGTNFVRDTETMALINKDGNSRDDYYMKRRIMETQKLELNNVRSELSEVKEDMKVIKDLLLKLMDKGSNG